MGILNQIIALVRKDLRVMKANKKATLTEILIPIVVGIAVGAFIYLIQLVQNSFHEYDDNPLANFWEDPTGLTWLGIVPNMTTAGTLVKHMVAIVTALGVDSSARVAAFNTSEEMLHGYGRALHEYVPGSKNDTTHYYQNYIGLNFSDDRNVLVQTKANKTIDHAPVAQLISLGKLLHKSQQNKTKVEAKIGYQDIFMFMNLRAIFSSTGTMMLIYAFTPSLILTGGRLVEDKRMKVRESLKVMGLSELSYLVSSYISSLVRMGMGTLIVALALAAFQTYDPAHIPAVFGIALLFSVSLISFAQIMPALFSVSIWSNVLCIMFLAIGAALSSISTGFPATGQMLTCLLSPVAFFYATLPYLCQGTVQLEVSSGGASLMMFIDSIIYCLIGNYIYAVAPGEFGVPKHPLFFIRWIWASKSSNGPSSPRTGGTVQTSDMDIAQSTSTFNGNRVVLDNLTKYYGDQRHTPSVDNLSLNIKKKEIFALLGHNGAGKTTTISILTGMITPTTYDTASVDGNDIDTQMDKIRDSVGLCPQFDVLINDLTARQHLEMFAEIKGIANAKDRIDELMEKLELPDTDQKASTFSGGTKRRLSVGNALVGDASLIFLDEPSSGMDPLSRRQMWDLLKSERDKGKTLVLTTHFMEEADYLGDRIAIMSRGKLFCCDSSQALKDKYGVGYYLTLVKAGEDDNGNGSSAKNDVQGARQLVQKHIPESFLKHESSGEATFLLPIDALPNFGVMLEDLERNMNTFGFHSYGISMNTLEDVFVSISEKEESDHKENDDEHKRISDMAASLNTKVVNGENVEGIFQRAMAVPHKQRVWSHIKTVFARKFTLLKRSRRMQVMVLGFPIFFLLVAFLTIQPQKVKNPSQFDGLDLPDYQDMHMVYLNLRDHEDNNKVVNEFRTLYATAFPGSKLTMYELNDFGDLHTGKYLPMHSVSFLEGFKTPQIVCGFLPHHMKLTDTSEPHTYTSYLVNAKFNNAVATQFIAMFTAAVERAAGNTNNTFINVTAGVFPSIGTETPAPPMPNSDKDGDGETTYAMLNVGIYMVLSVVQLVANCVIPVADEITRGVYHTNRAHGMTTLSYFMGNLCFDLLCTLIPFIIFTIMVYAKGIGAFYSGIMFWVLIAGFVFAIHVVLQAYVLVTYAPNLKPVTYTGILHGANLAMLAAPYLLVVVLQSNSVPNWHVIKPLILATTPPCSWYHILDNASDLTKSNTHASYVWRFDLGNDVGVQFGTGWGFVSLVVELCVPVFLIYRYAVGSLRSKRASVLQEQQQTGGDERTALLGASESTSVNVNTDDDIELEDADVKTERQRVEKTPDDNMVTTLKLRREFGYGESKKVAVKNLNLGIRKGECFGLLGPNGAGKSTTCKLILREMDATKGDVLFPSAHVNSATAFDEANVRTRLGVCQQGDTLWEFLTAREHLDQYLRLRLTTEYNPEDWKEYIDNAITKVYLGDAKDKRAGRYSGGMKRKLTVCLAMYSGAVNIFLDEPSTGMDPFSRRALWSVILEALSDERCVLLTTHSMEEADAVCARIGIITSGSLKCIGSSQHLKNRFSSGYVVTLVQKEDATEEQTAMLEEGVRRHFGSHTELKEHLGPLRRYGVGALDSLASAFKLIESKRNDWNLAQYSVTQTGSLEQIFLTFVGTQGIDGHEEDTATHK